MPRYYYTQLAASCYDGRVFSINQMREAVEYLKTQPQTEFTGLSAKVDYRSPKFRFWLGTEPLVSLDQIKGKTQAQIWEMFDADIDRQVSYFEGRFSSNNFRV